MNILQCEIIFIYAPYNMVIVDASIALNKVQEKMFIFDKILDNEHLMQFEQRPLIRRSLLDLPWYKLSRAFPNGRIGQSSLLLVKKRSIVLVKDSLSRSARETETVAYIGNSTVRQKYHGARAILDNATAIYFYYRSERKSIDFSLFCKLSMKILFCRNTIVMAKKKKHEAAHWYLRWY